MSAAKERRRGLPSLDLIDSAVNLLRAAPAGALLCYYLGAVPCLLGLLYFWADMSRAAFARQHLPEASLGTAALYLWMKCWHAVFASKLRARLLMEPEAPWSIGRVVRLLSIQTALQPSGLFLRLLAAQLLLPYVWTYAFYQNLLVFGDGTQTGFRAAVKDAARQAGLWPRQAHAALSCLTLFALFIWANILVLVAAGPAILKTLLGIETIFSRGGMAIFNSTFFMVTLGIAYLCFDPIRKAVFIVRCFHGASLQAGDDLRVELKLIRQRARPAAVAVLLFFCAIPGAVRAAPAAEAPAIAPSRLDESLARVLQRREFAWRLTREMEAETQAEKGWLVSFFEALWKQLTGTVKKVARLIADAFEYLRKLFERKPKDRDVSSRGWSVLDWGAIAKITLIALLVLMVAIFAIVIAQRRRGRNEIAFAEAIEAAPDLHCEDVTADQLPEEGWLQLARDLIGRGELRLALRASYLAGLAHLGSRQLIEIAKFKSNRDYDRELQRRARTQPDLLSAFGQNLRAFERTWYGEHAVTPRTLGEFSENLERIRAC